MATEEDEGYADTVAPVARAQIVGDGVEVSFHVCPPDEDRIADAIARRYFSDYGASKTLVAAVEARFDELVKAAVDDAAKAAIADAIAAPRVKTDEFGNPTGAPVTFLEMISDQVKAWQDVTVDSYDGKPKAADAYNRDRVITRAQWLVRQVGAEEFAKVAKEEVAKIKTQAAARVKASISSAVAEAVAKLSA